MSRLTKHIESKMRKEDSMNISANLNSRYYNIYSRIIRISNHPGDNISCDVSIIVPFNSRKQYIVQFKNSFDILILDYKEVKTLIDTCVLMWSMNYKQVDIDAEYYRKKYDRAKENAASLTNKASKLNEKLQKVTNRLIDLESKIDKGQVNLKENILSLQGLTEKQIKAMRGQIAMMKKQNLIKKNK